MSILDTLITNRTQADVDKLESILAVPPENWSAETLAEFNLARSKGSYNYTDLNRVTQAMDYINNQLVGYGYATGYQKIKIPRKGSGRLPEGYTELEYIQSSGTQYINTGVNPNQNTRIICTTNLAKQNTAAWLFGARNGSGDSTFGFLTHQNAYRSDYNTSQSQTISDTYTGFFTVDKDKNVTKINGETKITNAVGTFQTSYPLFLFANNNGGSVAGYSSCAIQACQIYDNGTLIRDYVPVKSSSGVVGLYDVVNGVFYTNAGTGEFVAGPVPVQLPDGYTQLEYIESSGTQYIDTGFKPNQDTRVVAEFEFTSEQTGNKEIFGARTSATSKNYSFAWISPNFRSDYNNLYTNTWEISSVGRYTVNKNGRTTDFNGIEQNYPEGTFQCDYELALFALNNAGTIQWHSSMRLYSCQIYDNGTIIRDYVPAKNSSGIVGLYDVLNDEFYQNAGTGTFTAGPEIPSEPGEVLDPYTWYESDIPTASLMTAYLSNVEAIRSTLEVMATTPETPESMEALTWVEANNIEQILLDVQMVIDQVINGMARSNSFTFWSGNRPFPTAESNLGRNWAELDAMNTEWKNWQVATWYLLLHGNLQAEGVVS